MKRDIFADPARAHSAQEQLADEDDSRPNTQDPRPPHAAKLTRAFENGELVLHYQPQVDVSRRWPMITGYEALARWPGPNGSFTPPTDFLPIAEGCGLMPALDMWVIETACQELAHMNSERNARRISVSANISAQHFKRPDLARSLNDILTRAGVDPKELTIEITERAVLDQDDATFRNFHALREIGVSLALDDFGTGYSSLLHLKSLPIQEIKLDRSFVFGLPDHSRDAMIASAMIELAIGLNLRVVAEGVELALQAEWLLEKGCTRHQGFLYGRPAPPRHDCTLPRPAGLEAS